MSSEEVRKAANPLVIALLVVIQEEILQWSEVENERDPVSERTLRRLTRIPIWSKQLEVWKRLTLKHSLVLVPVARAYRRAALLAVPVSPGKLVYALIHAARDFIGNR